MSDDDDLVEHLLSRAGALLEDASAVVINTSMSSGVPARIAKTRQAIDAATALVKASEAIQFRVL